MTRLANIQDMDNDELERSSSRNMRHVSHWETTSDEPEISGRPPTREKVDVTIIGGGYTGLSTALHCCEAGLSAQVLEARKIGFGGSGRNAGLVNPGVWLPPGDVNRRLGNSVSKKFLDCFGRGPDMVFDLIEKHQIQCQATRAGSIHAAHAPRGNRQLKNRWEYWNSIGAPVELLTRDEMAEITGSRAFHGGLLDRRAGTINPMAYCRGLARAAEAAGARIATGAHASLIRRNEKGWMVRTNVADVKSNSIILATNAYTDGLWSGLANCLANIHYFQFATEPLGIEANYILKKGQGIWDTGTIMRSLRKDSKNRLIIGSMGRLIGSVNEGVSSRWAKNQIRRIYPELGSIAFEQAWDGQIAITANHLPHVHKLDEGVYTPIGYNGRGIITGTIFGKAMADILSGKSPDNLPLPLTELKSDWMAPFKEKLYDLVFSANQMAKGSI